MTYDTGFRDAVRSGAQQSAAVLAPLLLEEYIATDPAADPLIAPRIVDVGCGEGWFALAFAELGCQVLGIDAPGTTNELGDRFIARDLEGSLDGIEGLPCDAVICLEVAEHLSPRRADGFVADLCRLANVVVFSAAIPGQGGVHHVNEQWPAYWARLFALHGFGTDLDFRFRIWNNELIEHWYRQNLLIFERGIAASDPLPLVHPRLFESRGWA